MSLTGKTALTKAAPVANDGFWPTLMIGELLENYRIPSEYADGVIQTGLTMAMIKVNEALEDVKDKVIVDGYATLAAYNTANPKMLAGKQVHEEHYKHAVFTRAKAGLLKNFAAINRRPQAENQAKEGDDMETYWLNESQASIAALFKHFLPEQQVMSTANTLAVLL